jgi:hypothetical protein
MKFSYNITQLLSLYEAKKKGTKPDFMDVDGDGDKTEPMKKALKDKHKKKQKPVKEDLQFIDAVKYILQK